MTNPVAIAGAQGWAEKTRASGARGRKCLSRVNRPAGYAATPMGQKKVKRLQMDVKRSGKRVGWAWQMQNEKKSDDKWIK
ncbi:hypothetical protein PAAG_01478 [Paracoccidioides lutzii Pb01]|uniref:Uncharacterized protein n=1 Tax=Paracoccidioides lutzii (strain ATCC MYA-826 / Pb01) TaxID=502779 RepID=C1GSI3_PARBA|nr:hypothetical protein PAAG_01478 [Paracoccidioides lutzii Pb01]EEH39016.2 hypothetical protein PAAG_01478 [Paracoccidioides lutzii Pb01]